MTQYTDLTQSEQEALALGDKWIRGALVLLNSFIKDADFDLKLQYWTDIIAPILTALDNGQTIPVASNHAGAVPLTATQLTAIKNWLAGIDSDMTSNLPLVVKAIGVNA